MPRDFFANLTFKLYFVCAFCVLVPVRILAAPSPAPSGSVGAVAQQDAPVTTTVALDVAPLVVSPGQTVHVTATISPSVADGSHATGTVTLWNGVHEVATRSVSFADGQAVFSTDNLPFPEKTALSAVYSGDAQFASSVSPPVVLTRPRASQLDSTTALTVSPSSTAPAGTVVTLSASVSNGGAPITPGLVLFYDRFAANSRETLLGQAQLTPSGAASIRLRLGVGSHNIRAAFQGTNAVAGSSSTVQDLTVTGTPLPSGPGTFFGLIPAIPPYVDEQQGAVAVGDFNNDGILDVAMADESSNLNILLGNRDGTFDQFVSIPLSYYGYNTTLVVADFNGDGKPDVAVVQTGSTDAGPSGVLVVLLGSGDGFFRKELSTTIPVPIAAAEGDFNGDGIPDLAITNENGSVSILLGTGYGRFEAARTIDFDAALYQNVFVADLNGDGIPDIATTVQNTSQPIGLLLGNGDGTFVPFSPAVPAGCGSLLAVTDFNGDGYQDLDLVCTGAEVEVLLGYGNGTFRPTTAVLAGVNFPSAVVADMNGDGIPDLVVTDLAGSDVQVLLGNGDGTFLFGGAVTVPASGFAIESAVGDFNGDGIPDVITAVENGYPWEQTGPVDRMGEWFGSTTPLSAQSPADAIKPAGGIQ